MYNPGYWKASPAAFKRDAEVYWQLLQASPKPQTPNPQPPTPLTPPPHQEDAALAPVAAHVTKCGVVPEAYCQKWVMGDG